MEYWDSFADSFIPVEWRHSSTHFMTSLGVKFGRPCSKLSDISKLKIIDKVSGTEIDVN